MVETEWLLGLVKGAASGRVWMPNNIFPINIIKSNAMHYGMYAAGFKF